MARQKTVNRVSGFFVALLAAGIVLTLSLKTFAKDRSQWANAPNREWYDKAATTESARQRLGFKSCCEQADVVHVKFKVDKTSGADEWYWDKHGVWKKIPNDVIHWGESGPEGEPVLFLVGEIEACFWPPNGGL